jgi:hypothetical protein
VTLSLSHVSCSLARAVNEPRHGRVPICCCAKLCLFLIRTLTGSCSDLGLSASARIASTMSTMDSSTFSEIGRYGTICFMKRNEPDTVVTAFGINTEQLTFGRDTTCDVRLYYPNVSLLHCKIIFEERKVCHLDLLRFAKYSIGVQAFLVVLGTNGLFVDRCKVYPSSTTASPSAGPTTIPLMNNSEIEIHNKRFRFTYPPKELRAALLATPSRKQDHLAAHTTYTPNTLLI